VRRLGDAGTTTKAICSADATEGAADVLEPGLRTHMVLGDRAAAAGAPVRAFVGGGKKGVGGLASATSVAGQAAPLLFGEASLGRRHLGCGRPSHLSREGTEDGPTRSIGRKSDAPGGIVRKRSNTAGPPSSAFSKLRSARFRDMGCPSLSGWGKSTAASGREQWGSTRLSKPSDP
jgi:hypothetical protein